MWIALRPLLVSGPQLLSSPGYVGDTSSVSDTPFMALGHLHKLYNGQEEVTGNQVLQGENRGDPGKCQNWPFDPGPLGHKDLLHTATWVSPFERPLLHTAAWQRVSPLECPSLHTFAMALHTAAEHSVSSCCSNAILLEVTVCPTHSALIQSVQSMKLHLPEGKSMTQNSYKTWVVHRLHLGPQRSSTRSPGFALSIHGGGPQPGKGLHPSQAVFSQNRVQGVGSRDGRIWKATYGQSNQSGSDRSRSTSSHMVNYKDRPDQRTPGTTSQASPGDNKSPNAAGPTQRPIGQPKRGDVVFGLDSIHVVPQY